MTDAKGKQKKLYDTCQMPYERLKSLPNATQYLKETITLERLESIANAQSDNACGERMLKEKQKLFAILRTH